MTPEERAEYARRYYAEHPELREYQREHMRIRRRLLRQKAAAFNRATASLHDLRCPYPTKGCRCRAVVVMKETP